MEMTERVIYKHVFSPRVSPGGESIIMAPEAQVLSVGTQRNRMVLWFKTTPQDHAWAQNRNCQRYFFILGTGVSYMEKDEPKGMRYVGTAQVGELVWHLHEEIKP